MHRIDLSRCRRIAGWLCATICLTAIGCVGRASVNEVVVYTALDREFSEPILQEFERQSGIRVLAKYDVESTKTIGLVNAILQERQRPRCDLFWNNEILHTLRLEKAGLLAVNQPANASEIPTSFRSNNGRWFGFAGRGRILLVNTQLVPKAEWPSSVMDLANEKWQRRCGIAKPLFGTTATHAAVLFWRKGDDAAKSFFKTVRTNAQVMSGNKQVATAVGRGQLAFGLTDTDDALAELDQGSPVAIIFPDQEPDQDGTLLIPNTLATLNGSPHPEAARKLFEFLLSSAVEEKLAEGASGQLPLIPGAAKRSRVPVPNDVRWMAVDFAAAAEQWESAATFLRDEFQRAD